jgi:hypothetical protein
MLITSALLMTGLMAGVSCSPNEANESLPWTYHMMLLGVRNASRLWTVWNTGQINSHAIGMPFLIANDNLHRKIGNIRTTSSHLTDELGLVLSLSLAKCYHMDQYSPSVMEVHVAGTECNVDQGI